MTTEILEKEYYEQNPQYSEVECIKCKEKTMRLIGIECFESDYDSSDNYEKTFYKCKKCGQQAYIEIEWVFTITI